MKMKDNWKFLNTQIDQNGVDFFMPGMKTKVTREEIDTGVKLFNEKPSHEQEYARKVAKRLCDKFYETEEYKSGETTTFGYGLCCDMMGFCGGMSGWIIFLIILLVLGALAGGAAAFWFFYWKRKNGGKDEKSIGDDNTDSTKSGNVVEMEIGKY